jgi:hypothetical protein
VITMSVTYIGAEIRRLVVERSEGLCEYCLIAEEDTFLGCQLDHIISEKHRGATLSENLANACVFCNQAKGTDIGSIHWDSGELIRFFNPRTDRWSDHFALSGYRIEPRTEVGTVTARILSFNSVERLLERQALQLLDRYPNAAARRRLQV